MVFYGLAVALIAVNVWQTHADVAKIVSQEASAVAALYRDVSSYPEPIRSRLQDQLRSYVQYVIHDAWPLQRKGQVPAGGVELMNRFQGTLAGFEPEIADLLGSAFRDQGFVPSGASVSDEIPSCSRSTAHVPIRTPVTD